MKREISMVVMAIVFAALFLGQASAQQVSQVADKVAPLTLRSITALPGVYGRIDHYDYDTKRAILIACALGNGTVEIMDSWAVIHTITDWKRERPQAPRYMRDVDRIAVSGKSGKLRFYDAESYKLLKTLDFGVNGETDNMRYDLAAKRLYVGYGDEDGAIAVVDPTTMERLQEYKLGSHPESFQLEQKGSRIFVNIPDQESYAVIDRKTGAVTKWKIPGNKNSHTMQLDEANHRLFSASLQPGRLTVVDSESGKVVAELPCTLGVDDIWYDAPLKRLYAPGAGFIDVFQQVTPDQYTPIARIRAGAGSTSYFVRTRTGANLYMSNPNVLPAGGSEILLYYVND